MKIRPLLLFSLLLFTIHLSAGGIRGTIRDAQGLPLAFASVFVTENGAGAVTNSEGYYELRLEPGAYTLVYQFLGYKSVVKEVQIGTGFSELDVTLQAQAYTIDQIEVSSNGEDPAYTVMRKAIAKAEYHIQQVENYQAKAYIKGTGKLNNIPWIVRRQMEKEGVDTSTAFTSESISRLEYQRPNTFKETVISVYTQGDDRGASPMSYINGSFYQPEIAEAVSPLSPRAFNFYKFELEGYFADRDYLVNKIKVTPRSRGENVFEGYIYIVDDYWTIHSLNLTTYLLGIRFDIEQVYTPIQEVAWMPITATFDISGKIFGFGFEYRYLASISDYELTLNPDLPKDFQVIDENLNKDLAKELKDLAKEDPQTASAKERLYTGEEVTRKELRKIMREMEKEERQETKEESEAPPVVSNYSYQVDSNAYKQDSAFWATVRPVPLTEVEAESYAKRDSIAKAEKVAAENRPDSTDQDYVNSNGRFGPGDLLWGERWKLADKQFLEFNSPIFDMQFNPLEGYNGTGSLVYKNRVEGNRLDVGLVGRYGFAWKRFHFKAYADMLLGAESNRSKLRLEGGRFVEQLNGSGIISETFNTLYSLLGRRNFVHMYQKEYAQLSYEKRWQQTASLNLSAEWANRRQFRNFNSDFTLFNREEGIYGSNLPFIRENTYYPDRQKAAILEAALEVRPWQKYRLRNGERQAVANSSPTLTLAYRKGIAGIAESESNFDHLDFTYRQTIDVVGRGKLDFKANAGAFLNNENVMLADMKHFPGTEMVFTTLDPVGSYRLLPYYEFSTQRNYLGASAHYQFRKLALTRIWKISLLGLKENVFVNYLLTPEVNDYVEVGYSLDNILRVLRVEAVANYYDGQYQGFGVRIGIASNIGGRFVTVNMD
ncbi:MAG TPA: DUF5686 and carboxypeptidase regulatory-like domain-containing protein [Saprospiraceae bacterium]|nr:DUF5686 and carboxypeptidase regulatory-like domain-containing protein [Saprospiraceae bacterium]